MMLAGCTPSLGGADPANGGPSAATLFEGFVKRKRAPELPAEAPVLQGAILSRAARTFTVRPMTGVAQTEVPQSVLVRVRSSTAIYLDTTASDVANDQQSVTKVDALEALNLQSTIGSGGGAEGFVQVWGEVSGNEYVATVIVVLRQSGRPNVIRTVAVDGGGNSGGY